MVIHIQPTNPSVSSVSVSFVGVETLTASLPHTGRNVCLKRDSGLAYPALAWHGEETVLSPRQGPAKSISVITLCLLRSSTCYYYSWTYSILTQHLRHAGVFPCDGAKSGTDRKSAVQLGSAHVLACMWAGISDSLHESGSKHHFHPRQLPWKSYNEG